MKRNSLVRTVTLSLIVFLNLTAWIMTARGAQSSAQARTRELRDDQTDQMQFVAPEGAIQFRVQIYTSFGELLFDSGDTNSQTIKWSMRDLQGNTVPDGPYSARLSIVNADGGTRTRVEGVVVGNPKQPEPTQAKLDELTSANARMSESSVVGSNGTTNKIAKWIDATTLGDSALSEDKGNVGIGTTTPDARLHIIGGQPADSTGNGIDAPPLLVLSGGKGGNSTGRLKTGGAGADILIVAGSGGDAALTGDPGQAGRGGNITIQPGYSGGSLGGAAVIGRIGKLLLAPFGGDVQMGAGAPGISDGNLLLGTTEPLGRLTVSGRIALTEGGAFGSGLRFSDGTVQTTAFKGTAVAHDTTLTGDGTSDNRLGVAKGSVGTEHLAVPLTLSGSGAPATPILLVNKTTAGTAIKATGDIETTTQYAIDGMRVLSRKGFNLFVGYNAGNDRMTGNFNVFVGAFAGQNTIGSENAFFGDLAGWANLRGSKNTFLGRNTGFGNANGINNTYVGYSANGEHDIDNATAIGAYASVTQKNSLVLGSINGENGATSDTRVGIGTTAPKAKLHVAGGDIFVGSAVPGQSLGVILKSPSGECVRLTIDDKGRLSTKTVLCPE